MSAIDATHPIGATKRAGKRAVVRSARGSGGGTASGCIGLVIAVAIVIAAVVALISLPGHILGWTPSISQIFKSNPPPGYLDARYQNIVLGYVLTVALLLVAATAIVHVASAQQYARARPSAGYVVAIVAIVAIALATHTGERAHMLSPAAAAGVALTPAQTKLLDSVANHATRNYSGAVDDFTIQPGWVTVPQRCSFAGISNDFLGTSYNFTCVIDGFNGRLHRAPVLRVTVSCEHARPTSSSCTSDADADVTETRRASRQASAAGRPTSAELARMTDELPALIARPVCARPIPKPRPQAISAAIDYDQLYLRYGKTSFQLVPGGLTRNLELMISQAARTNQRCDPTLATILQSVLPLQKR